MKVGSTRMERPGRTSTRGKMRSRTRFMLHHFPCAPRAADLNAAFTMALLQHDLERRIAQTLSVVHR